MTTDTGVHAPRIAPEQWAELDALAQLEIQALTTYGSVSTADVGDIDPVRANAIWRVGTVFGTERAERYSAPDWWHATKSERTVRRSKRGSTTIVRKYGRAVVAGDSGAGLFGAMVDALRHGSPVGHVDAIALQRLTDAWCERHGIDLPALIGTEMTQHHDIIPMSDADPRDIAAMLEHPVGLSGGICPRLDRAVGPEYRTFDTDPRFFPTSYGANGTDVRGQYRPSRFRMRARKGERPRTWVVRGDRNGRGSHWWTVTELLAASADQRRAFRGHGAYVRPMSLAERRTLRKRVAVDDVDVTGDIAGNIAGAIAERVDAGATGRWAWHADVANGVRLTGAFTVSGAGRIGVSGAGFRVVGARTPGAVLAHLRAQAAATR